MVYCGFQVGILLDLCGVLVIKVDPRVPHWTTRSGVAREHKRTLYSCQLKCGDIWFRYMWSQRKNLATCIQHRIHVCFMLCIYGSDAFKVQEVSCVCLHGIVPKQQNFAMEFLAQFGSGAIRCSFNTSFRTRFRRVLVLIPREVPEGSGADTLPC